MKKIFAVNGSPRPSGNTSFLLSSFLEGTAINHAESIVLDSYKMNLKNCTGCLRCNMIKRCSVSDDDWPEMSKKILDSDVLVFASPVYFHHLTAPAKMILDRFRSFIHVKITEDSLKHTPWQEWNKDFVLLLSMGSSNDEDAKPIIDLFEYMIEMMGPKNKLHVISATRLAVNKQITYEEEDLSVLYGKLGLPKKLAKADQQKNGQILQACYDLGVKLSVD